MKYNDFLSPASTYQFSCLLKLLYGSLDIDYSKCQIIIYNMMAQQLSLRRECHIIIPHAQTSQAALKNIDISANEIASSNIPSCVYEKKGWFS